MGIAIIAVIIFSEVRTKRELKNVKAQQEAIGGTAYPVSAPGPERRLYFLTDRGTAKVGHQIEDADRNVLYEAKMTKFTLTEPYHFDFIDHEHGTTIPHLVGHEESSESNLLLLDNHYTFTFDGEDIWKHLKQNGISVESRLNENARIEYRIFRDGREIAAAAGSNAKVHEEDEQAKGGLLSLVPVQGYYRITTTETYLSLLFVTLLAFARSGASDDCGGNYKTLFNTMKRS